jgi:hypothetical protein
VVVLLPNTNLAIRRRVNKPAVNEHGEDMLEGWTEPGAFYPGRTNENDNGRWDLAVDEALWPVRTGDLIVDGKTGAWSVQFVHRIRNNYDDYVNYVKISAVRRVAQGTEPGGSWFVARYEEVPDDPAVDLDALPEYSDGLWRGHGPPDNYPDLIVNPGDQYLDLDTGTVYEWSEP